MRSPLNKFRMNSDFVFQLKFLMLFDDTRSDRDDVLALPIFDEIELLQSVDDVFCFDGSHLGDFFDRQIPFGLAKHFQQHAGPIRSVRQPTEIREGLLGSPNLLLDLG